ncbi:MAG: hypothetical protein AAF604_03145 [Acidobacteriota bacterium]
MKDEPRAHRGFRWALTLTALGTVPFPFIGREPMAWLGLPVWLWWSGAFTLALSCVTAWGLTRYWRDDGEGEP